MFKIEKYKGLILFLLLVVGLQFPAEACTGSEVELTIEIVTDGWAGELYWELLNDGDTCGQNTLLSGGNPLVGCQGGGLGNSPSGGYPDYSTVTAPTICLTSGAPYQISWVDDFGDGGASFNIYIEGVFIHNFIASFQNGGSNGNFNFTAQIPPNYNAQIEGSPLIEQYTRIPKSQATPFVFKPVVSNNGINPLTNIEVTMKLFKNLVLILEDTMTYPSLLSTEKVTLTSDVEYFPTSKGTYHVEYKVEVDELDENIADDIDNSNKIIITDSTYARDDGNISFVTTVEFAGSNNAMVGQVFDIVQVSEISTIEVYVDEYTVGGQMRVHLYDVPGFYPGQNIAISNPQSFFLPGYYKFTFQGGPKVVAPGKYYAGIKMTGAPLFIGMTDGIYTENKMFFGLEIGGQFQWSTSSFMSAYYIRANVNPAACPYVGTSSFSDTCEAGLGMAVVNVMSGTPPFSYNWSSGATTEISTNLTPGTYTVTVSDAANCEVVKTVVVGSVGGTTQIGTFVQAPECFGSGGSISAFPIGGSGSYDFVWSNGTQNQTTQISAGGLYAVTATDFWGCESSTIVIVQEPLEINVNVTSSFDANSNTGSAFVNAIGGSGEFTYEWSTIPVQTGAEASDLSPGLYTVTATDESGCFAIGYVDVLLNRTSSLLLEEFSLYPNPATHQFSLEITQSENQDLTLTILNLSGKNVFTRSLGSQSFISQEVNVNSLARGVYLVQVSNGQSMTTKKLILY